MRKLQEPGSTTVRENVVPSPQLKIQPTLPPTAMSLSQGDVKEGAVVFGETGEALQSNMEMREPTTDSIVVSYAIALLGHYGFELRGYTAEELVNLWLNNYPAHWIRLAVIEALYQGRYKAVSVEQLLAVWFRRGQPVYRFNGEFERLISRKLPQNLTAPLGAASTDLLQEYNLPLLSPSSEDTADEQAIHEDWTDDSTPTSCEDTPLPDMTTCDEYTKTLIPPDNEALRVPFNPSPIPSYNANWSRCESAKQPIHQFTPQPDSSDFYLKLKAVVQSKEEIPPKVETLLIDEPESEPPCTK